MPKTRPRIIEASTHQKRPVLVRSKGTRLNSANEGGDHSLDMQKAGHFSRAARRPFGRGPSNIRCSEQSKARAIRWSGFVPAMVVAPREFLARDKNEVSMSAFSAWLTSGYPYLLMQAIPLNRKRCI